MNLDELRQLDKAGLQKHILDLLKQQFDLRMLKGVGKLNQTHLIKKVRRDIARAKTVFSEK